MIKTLLLGLLLLSLFSISGQSEENAYTFTNDDQLTYSNPVEGLIKVQDPYGYVSWLGFGIQGKVNGNPIRYVSTDSAWTWNKYSYQFNITDVNESYDEINTTLNSTIFIANNDNQRIRITMEINFTTYKPAKFKHIIINKYADITDAKFWYFKQLQENRTVKYNNIEYNLMDREFVHFTGNFNNQINRISVLGADTFIFRDLVNGGFDITDVLVGNGSLLGYPNKIILGIGVTKGTGVFPKGAKVILDPENTGWKSPADYGSPNNQWSNGQNIVSSNNLRATETTIGDRLSANNFSTSITDSGDKNITGIHVRVEGKGFGLLC